MERYKVAISLNWFKKRVLSLKRQVVTQIFISYPIREMALVLQSF